MPKPLEVAVEEVETAGDAYPENHPGLDDGHIDVNDEKIVYEYDDEGNLVGWHKESGK